MKTQAMKSIVAGKDVAGRFASDQRGSFLPIFGVGLTALMLAAGMAVDYTYIARSKTVMRDSLDAAILATGNDMAEGISDQGKLRQRFEDYFDVNMGLHSTVADDVRIDRFLADPVTGEVSATVSGDVEMAFFAIAGVDKYRISTLSEALFSYGKVEVAMMLDVTGSMGKNGKLDSLKGAANDAIDLLIPKTGNGGNVRIGLVPYSESVNAGGLARTVSGQGYTSCLVERNANAANDSSWKEGKLNTDRYAACPSGKLRPLTASRNALKDDLVGYRAQGYTAGHLGIQWSYYLLSENWRDLYPEAAKPAAYDEKVKKVAILMTDGEFNTYFNGLWPNQKHDSLVSRKKSADLSKRLCDDMKRAKGKNGAITIYSVAFDAPDAAKEMLKDCASDEAKFFDAKDGAELRTAFKAIANDIRTLRLTH